MNLNAFIERAKGSGFHLWIMNRLLNRMIPFNAPHGFTITSISDYAVMARIPYKRRNFNHIRGLHACALATLSEFTSGFLLISKLGFTNYRIILQRLEVDYHYQGKMEASAEFTISEEWMHEHVYGPLSVQDASVVVCEVRIYDTDKNQLTTARVHWQIKNWKKVKTKINT